MLQKRTGIRIVIGALLLIFFGIFFISISSYLLNSRLKKSNELLVHSEEVLYRSEKVLSVLKDIETGTRGFVITKDSIFLEPYLLSKASIPLEIAALDKLLTKDSNQSHRVKNLQHLADERLLYCKLVQEERLKPDYSLEHVKPLLQRGKTVMDSIRSGISKIQSEENIYRTAHELTNKQTQESAASWFLLLFISIIFLFIVSFFAARYFAKLRKNDSETLFNVDSSYIFFNRKMDEIIKGISDPFFALNKKLEFVFCNEAFRNSPVYGRETFLGKNIFELFPDYKTNILGEKLHEALLTNTSSSFEMYEPFPDKWYDVNVYPTAEGISVQFKDASQRKLYEKEPASMQDFLETTNHVAMTGGWEVDVISGKVYWTSVTRLIHETADDFEPTLREGINFYRDEESRSAISGLVQNAIESNTEWDTELPIITAKGNEKWIRTKGRPIFEDGECVRLVGTFQDISFQKKIMNELQKNEAMFRSAFENSPDGMSLIDENLKVIRVNPSFTRITGYTEKDFDVKKLEDMTHPEDRENDKIMYRKITGGETDSWKFRKRYISKSGRIIHAEATGSVVRNAEGKIISFVAQIKELPESLS